MTSLSRPIALAQRCRARGPPNLIGLRAASRSPFLSDPIFVSPESGNTSINATMPPSSPPAAHSSYASCLKRTPRPRRRPLESRDRHSPLPLPSARDGLGTPSLHRSSASRPERATHVASCRLSGSSASISEPRLMSLTPTTHLVVVRDPAHPDPASWHSLFLKPLLVPASQPVPASAPRHRLPWPVASRTALSFSNLPAAQRFSGPGPHVRPRAPSSARERRPSVWLAAGGPLQLPFSSFAASLIAAGLAAPPTLMLLFLPMPGWGCDGKPSPGLVSRLSRPARTTPWTRSSTARLGDACAPPAVATTASLSQDDRSRSYTARRYALVRSSFGARDRVRYGRAPVSFCSCLWIPTSAATLGPASCSNRVF
ncbi:hypothetical protein FKP32DRAFT_859936 [Trametes sanguinea]|nr:hypothetical protein FKP32DRAFT_859936 [Trametes sanguinea]